MLWWRCRSSPSASYSLLAGQTFLQVVDQEDYDDHDDHHDQDGQDDQDSQDSQDGMQLSKDFERLIHTWNGLL